ncbi:MULTISPECIES: LysR family transcriptional regulator [unclassified Rhizobium]|uniref:LysR family transcriptional regulator n=1 Tax=unclassified Rhizobium TaxID=2613769 RepID=UPI001FD7A6C9|nr:MULTISPECIES: LysR family transcriptional regulator [unclassified Rhizobium]
MDRFDCDRMFITVLDVGSFAGAARRLGTSTSQASKLVSKLEADLGVQLINRSSRALSPTEVGRAYYDRMKGLMEEIALVDASVRNASGLPTGKIRLTAPMSFGTICLAPLLYDFAADYPEIQLDVSFSDRVVNLIDEGFDMAVRIGTPSDSTLIARKICDARFVIVAAPAYLERHGTPSSLKALSEHECIIDMNFRDPNAWRFKKHDINEAAIANVSGRLSFSDGEACLGAAVAGLGIARVPSFIAGPFIREGSVVPILADVEMTPLGVHALYPPSRHLAPKIRVLLDHLAARLRGKPEWDRGW